MASELTYVQSVIDGTLRSRIVTYVQERRCPSGGYCYYRLDEPNAGDTYYALHTLTLLGEKVHDKETEEFLLGLQNKDGSYSSYSAALFAGRSLVLLDISPFHDVIEYITKSPPNLDARTRVIEAFSLFEPLLTRTCLHTLYGIALQEDWQRKVIKNVLRFQTQLGGFGSPVATLQDTWQAAEVLLMLKYPPDRLDVTRFIRSCEDPEFGFIGKPGSHPPYLEHIYAGLRLSALLGVVPRYQEACRVFLKRCTHHSGGFVRSVFGGSPTLEFTALSVESLFILAEMSGNRRDSCG